MIAAFVIIGALCSVSFVLMYVSFTRLDPGAAPTLLVALIALIVSLAGFIVSTVFSWRADRRAEQAERRAQEEHMWRKVERKVK
jgi:uncharacterized membrane protein (DUF485 family)